MEATESARNPIEVMMEEFVQRRRRGETPTVEEYEGKLPHLAVQIRNLFPAFVLLEQAAARPERLGRYEVTGVLGQGGFGVVYRGHDPELRRTVAIKVPRRDRVDVEQYLVEARLAARLNHSGIVPVYDCGRTDDGRCYVVSQYVPGGDLAALIGRRRLSFGEAADVVVRIAEALHHAHQHGLVHRLGVVFYELLTGRRPYRHLKPPHLFEEISSGDTRPPRQLDHTIPKELERICLVAMAKRAGDRYTTAFDLAEDLRQWRSRHSLPVPRHPQAGTRGWGDDGVQGEHAQPHKLDETRTWNANDAPTPSPPKIIPKGLRSFDAQDADFFLQLLPGPCDRDGLPESIRFWKARIEAKDDRAFRVGLLYGPSGCGKSSLVKAGLIPRLAAHKVACVDAAPDDTEVRLLRTLEQQCLELEPANLVETLAALRRGKGAASCRKVLIVLDQFEQWLHAHRDPQRTELVAALRQCDGPHVQCLIMVRDDFWLASTARRGGSRAAGAAQ
jgi:eukaryotic-like serine/threonine-protein kinase